MTQEKHERTTYMGLNQPVAPLIRGHFFSSSFFYGLWWGQLVGLVSVLLLSLDFV